MNMVLTKHLENWRAERPDEWKMDEFIRKAALLESSLLALTKDNYWNAHITDSEEAVIDSLVAELKPTNQEPF
jgi:hypothetical protein